MSFNIVRPEEWPGLVERIRDENDKTVGMYLAERERRFDNYFATIDKNTYTPQLWVGNPAIPSIFQVDVDYASSGTTVEGYRIGTAVHLNVHLRVLNTNANTGDLAITLPPLLPSATKSFYQDSRPVGQAVAQGTTSGRQVGAAVIDGRWGPLYVSGVLHAGGRIFAAAGDLNAGNSFGFSIQYITTAESAY